MRQCHPSPLPQLAANTRHAAPPALPAVCAQLSGRRLQNHGGIVHAKGLIPAPIPSWLQQLLKALPAQLLGLFPADQPPNHVLINSYQPGCGIMVRTSCLWLSCSFPSCVFWLICTMTHSVWPAAKHLPMAQVCCLCLPQQQPNVVAVLYAARKWQWQTTHLRQVVVLSLTAAPLLLLPPFPTRLFHRVCCAVP